MSGAGTLSEGCKEKHMKNNKMNDIVITIIAVVITIITILLLWQAYKVTAYTTPAAYKDRVNNSAVIQKVLEDTLKANGEITLMAVYSDDGTILAHFKPERIGKNMFDVEEELGDSRREMYKAMKNRKIYIGQEYDPSLGENIKFIVKPLQIGNSRLQPGPRDEVSPLAHNLSLLIGVSESYLIRETGAAHRPAVILSEISGSEEK